MNFRRMCILLASIGMILLASTAIAGSMHSHSHGHAHLKVVSDGMPLNPNAVKAASPFEVKPGGKVLHCKLLGHNPLIPCPHHKVPADGKDECYLTAVTSLSLRYISQMHVLYCHFTEQA